MELHMLHENREVNPRRSNFAVGLDYFVRDLVRAAIIHAISDPERVRRRRRSDYT